MTRVQSFSCPQILKVLMIRPDQEWVLRPLQPVPPFLQSNFDGEKFPVSYILIPLRR